MVHAVTEHDLQETLTARWMSHPPEIAGLNDLTLVAWEVMFPSWKINDSQTGFGEPAVDFVFIADPSSFVLVELKLPVKHKGRRRLRLAPAQFLKSLCQVSHQAILFAASYSPERLLSAFLTCKAGAKGRMFDSDLSQEVLAQRIIKGAGGNLSLRIYRVVAAPEFPVKANSILEDFNNSSHAEVLSTQIANYKSNLTFKRFAEMSPDAFHSVSMEPIVLFKIQPANRTI